MTAVCLFEQVPPAKNKKKRVGSEENLARNLNRYKKSKRGQKNRCKNIGRKGKPGEDKMCRERAASAQKGANDVCLEEPFSIILER